MTTLPARCDGDGWQDVRCPSPSCDRAEIGGRLLFRRKGELVIWADKQRTLIAVKALGAICRCGAEWRNPELTVPIDQPAKVG